MRDELGESEHIAGVVASGDELTIRLRAPAPDFLPRIAQPAFCAVPSNTPIDRNGVRVIPSAGPHHVASNTPRQGVVLVRNPNYHGSRPHHFARIEFAVGISGRRAVHEIETGAADYTELGADTFPSHTAARLATQLAARYGPGSVAAAHNPPQYFVNPVAHLDYFYLNTHRKLFSDVHMRRAVNYAIDGDHRHPLTGPLHWPPQDALGKAHGCHDYDMARPPCPRAQHCAENRVP